LTIRKVLRAGRPLLRQRTRAVQRSEWDSKQLNRLVEDMIETMGEEQGVGLAAPQVQVGLRVLVYQITPNSRYPDVDTKQPPRVLINPQIKKRSAEMVTEWEGCLSFPELRAKIPRHESIELTARNRDGDKISFRATGFEARVIQHELDHLNGRLLVDRVRDPETIMFSAEFQRFHGSTSTDSTDEQSTSEPTNTD